MALEMRSGFQVMGFECLDVITHRCYLCMYSTHVRKKVEAAFQQLLSARHHVIATTPPRSFCAQMRQEGSLFPQLSYGG